MDIDKAIQHLYATADQDLQQVHHSKEIEPLKVKYLGKKGVVQELMQALRQCTPDERPRLGKGINDLKEHLSERLNQIQANLETKELQEQLEKEKLDVTLPGRRRYLGRKHVIKRVLDEAIEILQGMGFSVQDGPEIETDYYNFEALNFSKDHPARDMQDTFYISSDYLLRTHTSNAQVRIMERHKPPIRVITPGKCYRNEDVTARSHVMFHQIDGLYIDRNVSFSDLLTTLEEFFGKFFQKQVAMRYRPSFFPFVEPGLEVDVGCISCDGHGCSLCKHTGWLEVAGAGMVHPEVLKSGGIDSEEYLGYAWGFGIERLTMLRFGIPDIRLFFENNMRLLEQF